MSFLVYVFTKRFKPDFNSTHPRDLNIVLCSEIFVHYNGQLRVSHLILDCIPSYTSYQDPRQALTVGNLLLSYIDVHLWGFLLRGLTLGEARRLGLRQIRKGSLLLVTDSFANWVFHDKVEHIPVEELAITKPVMPLNEETESEESTLEMVVWRKITTDCFLPRGWSALQQPYPPTPYGCKGSRSFHLVFTMV